MAVSRIAQEGNNKEARWIRSDLHEWVVGDKHQKLLSRHDNYLSVAHVRPPAAAVTYCASAS